MRLNEFIDEAKKKPRNRMEIDPMPDVETIHPDNPNYKKEYHYLNSWVARNMPKDTKKEFAVEYLKSINYDISKVEEIPSSWYGSVGTIGWILAKGATLAPKTMKFFSHALKQLELKGQELAGSTDDSDPDEMNPKKALPMSRKEKARDQYLTIKSRLDNKFENGEGLENYYSLEQRIKFLSSVDISPRLFNTLLDDYTEAAENGKESTMKGYNEAVKNTLIALKQVMAKRGLLKQANAKSQSIKKAQRTGRPVKASSTTANYLAYSEDFNIQSISPDKVNGKVAMLTFRPSKKELGFYVVGEGSQLQLDGSKITGFDRDASFFRILKKASPESLAQIQAMSLAKIKKLIFQDMKTTRDVPARRKLNNQTLILAVY